MTKEEIQAQIDFIENYPEFFDLDYAHERKRFLIDLKLKLQSAKSIKDLQREAFEAGRELVGAAIPNTFTYDRFEDYLKSLENGKDKN